ncbi:MAG: hypothetical protein KatS3mg057_3142 [Herpetosiphonaceae bacterium]|nr:MAG: hypothetical protein KatS3mg057_3142 [Herpetosiphonaceae bacterium]
MSISSSSARQQLLASRYAPHRAGLSLDDRVVELARILTEQGYMAEDLFPGTTVAWN